MTLFSLRGKVLPLLQRKFEASIPQFKPNSVDYQMVVYAHRDLVYWFMIKESVRNFKKAHVKLEKYQKQYPLELESFLIVWLSLWFRKWKERVKIMQRKIKIPEDYLCRIEKARKFYQRMKNKDDLEELIMRRLIGKDEICMTRFIAKNLIIGEIARFIQKHGNDKINQQAINAFDILNSLSLRIKKITNEKGPLVYLRMGIYLL